MTSETDPKTILLRGNPVAGEGEVITGAITPGMAIAVVGSALPTETRTMEPAGAGYISPAFARENELVGDGIDDAYAIGDWGLYYVPQKGDQFYALLADTENVAAGADLACGAGGELVAAGAAAVVARALVALNNTSGAAARIKVEVV